MGSILAQSISLLIAGVILVNVGSFTTNAILDAATDTANAANAHQLSTAIELYRLDHDTYPNAQTGDQLIRILSAGGYIEGKPLDVSVFAYEQRDGGQSYNLKKN